MESIRHLNDSEVDLRLVGVRRARLSRLLRQFFHAAVRLDLSWGTPHDEDVAQGEWRSLELTLTGRDVETNRWTFGGDFTSASAAFDRLESALSKGRPEFFRILDEMTLG